MNEREVVKTIIMMEGLFNEASENFKKMADTMNQLKGHVSSDDKEVVSKDKTAPKKDTKKDDKAPVEEVKAEDSNDYESMSINEVRALAKSKGLKASGKKDDIIARLLEAEGVVADDEEDEEVVEDTVDTTDENEDEEVEADEEEESEEDYREALEELELADIKAIAKELKIKVTSKSKKTALIESLLEKDEEELEEALIKLGYLEEDDSEEDEDVEDTDEDSDDEEEDEDDEDSEDDEEEEESIQEQVEEYFEEYSDKELKEVLEEAGKSTKGKRQALLARIVDAVEEGLISLEEDDEDEDDSDDDTMDNEIDGSVREEAVEELKESINNNYSKGKLKDKEVAKFLEEWSNGNFKAKNKKQALAKYIEVQCNLIDDDGEAHDLEEAYYIDEEAYCCGEALKEADGVMICEHCGEEYED